MPANCSKCSSGVLQPWFCFLFDISLISHLKSSTTELSYPGFPISAMDTFVLPHNLHDTEKRLLQTLSVDE